MTIKPWLTIQTIPVPCRDQVESQMYIDNKISMVNTYMLV